MRENMTEASPKKSGAVVWGMLAVFIAASLLAAIFWPSADPVEAVVSAVPPKPVPAKPVAPSLPAEDRAKVDETDGVDLSSDQALIKAGLAEYGSKPPASNLSASWLRARAEEKDPTAFLPLGALYAMGDGVIKDDEEAAKWFRLHARALFSRLRQRALAGDTEAMTELYRRLINGVGLPENDGAACAWVLKKAESCEAMEISAMARELQRIGDERGYAGRPTIMPTYQTLLEKAAYKGGPDEQVKLADFIANSGFWKDHSGALPQEVSRFKRMVEGYAWYNVAAAMRHPYAAAQRDAMQEVSAAGQKRSREILLEIEKLKASK